MDIEFGAPWGLSRVTDRLPPSPLPYREVVLDPDSQTARYYDDQGRVIDMGRHGTNKQTGTASKSGGGDGAKPQSQTSDDSTTDYESD